MGNPPYFRFTAGGRAGSRPFVRSAGLPGAAEGQIPAGPFLHPAAGRGVDKGPLKTIGKP